MKFRKNYFKILCSMLFCFALGTVGCSNGDPNASGDDPTSSSSLAPDEFLVTFDTKGGTAVAQQVIKAGNKVSKPDDPTQEYYTFKGWYWDFDEVTPFDFENVTIAADTVIYAGWTPDHSASGLDNEPVGGGGGGDTPVSSNVRKVTEKWTNNTYIYLWKNAGGENAPFPGVKLTGEFEDNGYGGKNFSVNFEDYDCIIISENGSTTNRVENTNLAGLLNYSN